MQTDSIAEREQCKTSWSEDKRDCRDHSQRKVRADTITPTMASPEITARFAQAKVRIVEVPISYNPRSYAEGKKISWRDGAAAVWHIIKFRFSR